MKTIIFTFILFAISLGSYAQSFVEFNTLKDKAYSAYEAKDYALCVAYFEKLIRLSESKKPQTFEDLYYDIACSYSLNKNAKEALRYLEKSFKTDNAKRKENPVSASHISSDGDLDFIRNTKQFEEILRKYYRPAAFNFITSKEISYNDLIDYIQDSSSTGGNNFLSIGDKTISWEKANNKYILNNGPLIVPKIKGAAKKTLEFINCNFQLNFIWSQNSHSGSESIVCGGLQFENCVFNGRFFAWELELKSPPHFRKCDFKHNLALFIDAKPDDDYDGIKFDSCFFRLARISVRSENKVSVSVKNNLAKDSSDFIIDCNNVSVAEFTKNSFDTKNVGISFGSIRFLKFDNNEFNNLTINNTDIQSEFDFQNTIISNKLVMLRSFFSPDAPTHDIDWGLIDNSKLGILIPYETIFRLDRSSGDINYPNISKLLFLTGDQTEAISNAKNFRELMGLHSMFLNLYKIKNDIESYNGCFVAIKELQSKRLKYLYHSNKTFESYFRWKLSQLLKYYVRYGTDPARAIVISVYIIIVFGIFFFFFPSDWDQTSKSRLIQNYKDFIQKNEKGYLKPFLVLLAGFLLSLLNAVTLSLNAFITLGFGNIPTHGIARYFCILEGFFGWFLLSIFTVAMINQVL